jgi:uncharacterized protein YidB (DUF937 family)
VENLEDRIAPALAFTFTLDDPTNQFGPFPGLMSNLQAAGQILSPFLNGKGSMDVVVRPDNTIPRANAGPLSSTSVRTEGAFTIVENGTISEARTGTDPNGASPDIVININTTSYLPTQFLDPSGANRTALMPSDQGDFISVALHEILHALGFTGFRETSGPNYGQFPLGFQSTYDVLTAFEGGNPANTLFFHGSNAIATFGGPVPLTTGNFSHIGNPEGQPGAELLPDLMNGVTFSTGTRYSVSNLDLAILADLGWNTLPAPALAVTSVGPVSPDPRQTVVETVDVTFSQGLKPGTFDVTDLTLTRDGGSNLITDAVTVTLVTGFTYRIGNLAGLTQANGTYRLTVNATGVQDALGKAGIGSAADSWVMEVKPAAPALAFTFTLDDPTNLFGAFPDLMGNLQAAGQILSTFLSGQGSMDVVVRPDNTIPRGNGGTVTSTFVRTEGAFTIVENGTLSEARTGIDPNDASPDITINLNTVSYLPIQFFDPSGANRTASLPVDQVDFISVALHEIVHALGFQGFRESNGQFSLGFQSTFDALTAFQGGDPASPVFFNGSNAIATFGGPVPLTSGNFSHIGNPEGQPGAELVSDLMNGVSFLLGTRYSLSNLDLAILADLGWNTVPVSDLAVTSIGPVDPDPRQTVVDTVDVTFSTALNSATFDFMDLALTRDGGNNLITDAVTVTLVEGSTSTYRIGNLAGLTQANGTYQVTVDAAGVQDALGTAGVGAASDSWVMDALQVLNIVPVSPDPRKTTVDTVDVTFSQALDLATLDFTDLTLTRDGGSNLITAAVTVTLVEGSTYRIGNLAGLTQLNGTFQLTVNAGGVQDALGKAGVGRATDSWVMDAVQVTNIVPVSPGPRKTAVPSIDVTFSEPINLATFNFADLGLKRNGVNVVLRKTVKAALLPGTTSTYRISGLTSFTNAQGNYQLTVQATGLSNVAGVAGVGSQQVAWTTDKTRPKIVSAGPVTPTLRATPVDFIDFVSSENLNFATIDFKDIKLTRKGSKANLLLSGATLTRITDTVYRISNLAELTNTAGIYTLTVNGGGFTDLAGNTGSGVKKIQWVKT